VTFQPATESLAVLTQLNAFAGGYFDKEKLDITYNPVISNAAQAAQSVTNGSADIAIVGSTGVVAGVAARRDLVTVAVITKGPTTQITLRNDVIKRLGIDVSAPLATRMKALKGLKLALPQPGSTTDVAVRQALKLNGLDPDKDLTIRPITDPSALVTAAREGQVDGFGFSPPTSVQPVAAGYGTVWVTLSDIPQLKRLPWIDVVTSKAYLKNNREAVTRFVRALYKSSEDLKARPDEARTKIKAKYFPDLNQKVYDLAYDLSLPTATQGIDPEPSAVPVLMSTVNANLDTKIDVTAAQLYDLSVLADAKKKS
jgi:NitT/TauT family transport system substrate-binding protein